ncbi:dUTP diphosphatase, partial [Corynebacterium accolens]
MPVYYQLDDGATPPRHAHAGDAGIDLALNHFLAVPPGGHKLGSTGVHVAIPHGHVGMIFVR